MTFKLLDNLKPRNPAHYDDLINAADMIKKDLKNCEVQPYTYDGRKYENIIVRVDNNKPETIILGAHYDSYGNSPGFNDNFSSCLLLLDVVKNLPTNFNWDVVFFALEEPPIFGRQFMGSDQFCGELKKKIRLAIVVEMVGDNLIKCFGDREGIAEVKTDVLEKMEIPSSHYMYMCDCLSFQKYGHKTVIVTGIDEATGPGTKYHTPQDNHLSRTIMIRNRDLFVKFLRDFK
jgi:Iap family predicted aminopeptidase